MSDLQTKYLTLLNEARSMDPDSDNKRTIKDGVIRIVDSRLRSKHRYYTGCQAAMTNPRLGKLFPESLPTPEEWVEAARRRVAWLKLCTYGEIV